MAWKLTAPVSPYAEPATAARVRLEGKVSAAVPSIMNTVTGHERAEFGVLAFEEFDAASEVGTDSDAMVRRWRPAVRRAQAGA